MLLAIENYGIFDPVEEVGRDSAPAVAPDTHEVFDEAEEGGVRKEGRVMEAASSLMLTKQQYQCGPVFQELSGQWPH